MAAADMLNGFAIPRRSIWELAAARSSSSSAIYFAGSQGWPHAAARAVPPGKILATSFRLRNFQAVAWVFMLTREVPYLPLDFLLPFGPTRFLGNAPPFLPFFPFFPFLPFF